MDDHRRPLSSVSIVALTLAILAVPTPGHTAPTASPVSHDEIRARLWEWKLDDADALLSRAADPTSVETHVLRARLDLLRGRHDAVIERLGPRASGAQASPELRVVLGAALDARGRREEARLILDVIADLYDRAALAPSDRLWLAVSLEANDYPADANDIFREVLADPDPPMEAYVRWARLFRARYNHRDAGQLLDEALAKRASDPMAQVELAAVEIDSDRDYAEATDRLGRVLETSPQCVPAHNLLARIDIENERPAVAIERLEKHSLKLAPHDMEALSLMGAARALLDDEAGFKRVEAQALKVNPRAASFYTTVSEHLARMHRYAEAAALDERAIALDPRHWKAYTSLGIGRSRLGDDAGAVKLLERAHEGNPYEVRTYNLLERFYDKPIRRFEWVDVPPMRLRLHEKERAVLERVIPPLIDEAYRRHAIAYGVEAQGPVHLEIFPDPEMFSVRSTGLPRLGAHGICFGHLITARSPSAGNFNWAEVLWHELSHVFHIQLSHSRVPRWFTEGLAIYEATDGRPQWRREMDETLVAYRDAGRLRGVAEFNLAFTRARSMEDILVAYYHAYLVATFIVERHGRAVMPAMLRSWGAKMRTAEVFARHLDVEDLSAFDRAFDHWLSQRLARFYETLRLSPQMAARSLDERVAAAKERPEDPEAIARVAEARLGRGDLDQALELAHKALELNDQCALARLVRGRARYSLDDLAGAREDLRALVAAGHDDLELRRTLARIAARARDNADAIVHLEAALTIDPQQGALYPVLIDLLEHTKKPKAAYAWRRRAIAVDQSDRDLVAALLAGAARFDATEEEIRAWGEMGLHIAPFDADLQVQFATELSRIGDRDAAREVLGTALAGSPTHKGALALSKSLGL